MPGTVYLLVINSIDKIDSIKVRARPRHRWGNFADLQITLDRFGGLINVGGNYEENCA
jgi:hypothetical protein